MDKNLVKHFAMEKDTNPAGPYKESATNLIYNLLFCDSLELYKQNTLSPFTYPFDILFSESGPASELQKLVDDPASDPRVKLLAYRQLASRGQVPQKKELLGVIVEVGLEDGLDVLAAFNNRTARYINQTGKILIWETTDDEGANQIIDDLFAKSAEIVSRIGPWNEPRRPGPGQETVRISFLVSDGLYFGEGPIDVLFNDALAGPALGAATELLQYLTEQQT